MNRPPAIPPLPAARNSAGTPSGRADPAPRADTFQPGEKFFPGIVSHPLPHPCSNRPTRLSRTAAKNREPPAVPSLDPASRLTSSRDCRKLARHCDAATRQETPPVPYTQLFEGDSIFSNRHCREGACPAPFDWLVLVETLKTGSKPSRCRLGGKRNFPKRSASFLIRTVGDERVW